MLLALALVAAAVAVEPAPPGEPVVSETEATSDAGADVAPSTGEAAQEPAPASEAPSPDLSQATAEALYAEARRRIERGDHEGAQIVLAQAADRPGADPEEGAYLAAVAVEFGGDRARALEMYTDALARWPEGDRADDLRFRRAEALGILGEPRRALREVRSLEVDGADALKVDLLRGVWWVDLGRTRKGLRRLGTALSRAGDDDVTFYQAKARATIARADLAEAARLDLDRRPRPQARRLERRAVLIQRAEKQVTATALLEEPEWVFDGLLALGAAYEDLADALLDARVPSLTDEQRALYDEALGRKVEVLLVKAGRHYDRGVDLALRLDWESRRVDELVRARDALRERIDRRSSD